MRRICTSESVFQLLDEHGFNCFVGPDMEIYASDSDYKQIYDFLSSMLPSYAFFIEYVPADEFSSMCDFFDFHPLFID